MIQRIASISGGKDSTALYLKLRPVNKLIYKPVIEARASVRRFRKNHNAEV